MGSRNENVPVAVTMGDPAGVGLDIILSAWQGRSQWQLPDFFVIADPGQTAARAKKLGIDVRVLEIGAPRQAVAGDGLPVLPVDPPVAADRPGKPDDANAEAILASISTAVTLTQSGQAGSVVTCPINKASLYRAGFGHPGHTEFLAELCGVPLPVMMLICPGLRVVPVTVHLSLRKALELLDRDLIVSKGRITAAALARDFGLERPRIAVAGLNPHAGEDGSMGDEEIEIIGPAIEILRSEGIDALGPMPPDTMFGEAQRQGYDAALCMYHDQALIPLKTLDFHGGVNITLGLPIVRTSPDHGTAFDIAGTGRARADSLVAAIREADRMAQNRRSAG
jgi:4-hydroxythreonine-4-phosphate dehydrogenase